MGLALLIGSKALAKATGLNRVPKDVDIIASYDDAMKLMDAVGVTSRYPLKENKYFGRCPDGTIIDAEIAWPGSTGEQLIKIVSKWQNPLTTVDQKAAVILPPIHVLYALKMSHRFKKNSPFFLKTMEDIKLIRRNIPSQALIASSMKEWFKAREKETYDYGHPSLDTTKEGFFRDEYKYDHDSIHRAVAIGREPAYLGFMAEGAEVMFDRKKFQEAPHWDKINAGYEESAVLALERSLIPHPGAKTPAQAFEFALQKVCTSITSGPFREFCWENYDTILEMGKDEEFYDDFNRGVANGTVVMAS